MSEIPETRRPPTPEYLALKDSPAVLLCEAAADALRFVRFALHGRAVGAAERYVVTSGVADNFRSGPVDRSMRLGTASGLEVGLLRRLDSAIEAASLLFRDVTLREDRSDRREFSLPGRALGSIRDLLASPEISPYLPNAPRFMEVRASLWAAQGLVPPGEPEVAGPRP